MKTIAAGFFHKGAYPCGPPTLSHRSDFCAYERAVFLHLMNGTGHCSYL